MRHSDESHTYTHIFSLFFFVFFFFVVVVVIGRTVGFTPAKENVCIDFGRAFCPDTLATETKIIPG